MVRKRILFLKSFFFQNGVFSDRPSLGEFTQLPTASDHPDQDPPPPYSSAAMDSMSHPPGNLFRSPELWDVAAEEGVKLHDSHVTAVTIEEVEKEGEEFSEQFVRIGEHRNSLSAESQSAAKRYSVGAEKKVLVPRATLTHLFVRPGTFARLLVKTPNFAKRYQAHVPCN